MNNRARKIEIVRSIQLVALRQTPCDDVFVHGGNESIEGTQRQGRYGGGSCFASRARDDNQREKTMFHHCQKRDDRAAKVQWRRAGAAFLTVAILAAGPALAEPPGGKGGGKGQGHGQGQHGNPSAPPDFAANDRSVIQSYYATPIKGSNCPPGLAKKNNGCMPPGQAKQYTIGKPLPAGVMMYPLPSDLLERLAPPPGYQYTRVGTDILILTTGSNMVVSALTDMVR